MQESIDLPETQAEKSPEQPGNDVERVRAASMLLLQSLLGYVGHWMSGAIANMQDTYGTQSMVNALRLIANTKEAKITLMKTNGGFLQFLEDGDRADRDIVRAACLQNSKCLQYASPALRADRLFMLELIRDPRSFHILYEDCLVKDDPGVAKEAVCRFGSWALGHVPSNLRSKPDIIDGIFDHSHLDNSLAILPEMTALACSQNEDGMLRALKVDASHISCADPILLANRTFLEKAFAGNIRAFLEYCRTWRIKHHSESVMTQLAIKAVGEDPTALQLALEGMSLWATAKIALVQALPLSLLQQLPEGSKAYYFVRDVLNPPTKDRKKKTTS